MLVLDPMCGSGTVLSAASERGHIAIGLDMDPLAVLMADVATTPLDASALRSAALAVERRASQSRARTPPWSDDETDSFARYWFGSQQLEQLVRVIRAIDEVDNLAVRNALRVALSRTIVTKAPKASLAADTSHSRPHKVIQDSDYDVVAGFRASADSLAGLLAKRALAGSVTTQLGDARRMSGIADGSVDAIVTSPPYLNAIDYLRGHRLALIWLGHSIASLRLIRSNSIGSERGVSSEAESLAIHIVDSIRSHAAEPERLPERVILRYAHDLCQFATQAWRVLKPGSEIVSVVGNSTLRGNYIPNAQILSETLANRGFTVVSESERPLPDNKRYMPIGAASDRHNLTKRMRTEVVLVAKKRGR